MKTYVNYHKHSDYSNLFHPDSVTPLEDYVARIKELGHSILSSCEHGTQGNVYLCDTLAKANNLKWRYVTEAYFVKDRFQKDKTNAHIIVAARNDNGRKAINAMLSEANLTGFYYRPRIDMSLLLCLNPKDVFITTACIGGVYQYGLSEAEQIILALHEHFGTSLMLEVQNHNNSKQVEINTFLRELYFKFNIPLIFGADSHYIYPKDAELRDVRLADKGIIYPDERDWYMDYPDYDTAFERFQEQGVLSNALIAEAIDNTNIFETFEDIKLDTSPKIPSLFPDSSKEQINLLYETKTRMAFDDYTKDMLPFEIEERRKGMEYEINTIVEGGMADYPLLTSEIVAVGKMKGGVITKTGRGSAPSFFTNMLLGFSSIDRFSMPVTMYPDRFVSKERLLAGSFPDVDHNVFNRQPFIDATRSILGKDCCYPMVAFGTLKHLSAWKMYCRAKEVPFDVSNTISSKIKAYEIAKKHADDPDDIDILNFIPHEYVAMLKESEKYLGIIDSISPHPCAYLILDKNIKEEIGIFRLKATDENGNPVYGAFIDGAMADAYGYLKQDFLLVDVVGVNNKAYELAGIKMPSASELISLTHNDKPTWDIFANGITCGINQLERDKTTERVKVYKPCNIVELAAFIAAIRPAFSSMLSTFLMRKPFKYGIPALDKLISTPEMPSSFLIYQEQLMKILQYGGLSPADSYLAIKAIAKKHPEKIIPIKEGFCKAFSQKIINDSPNISEAEAEDTTQKIWTIIEDSCGYLFNASHAISVALDALYGAYIKAHYPLAYYSAFLEICALNGDKERIARAKAEAKEYFSIKFEPCKFRSDNRAFTINNSENSISDTLKSIKYMSANVAEELYSLKDFNGDFIDLLVELNSGNRSVVNSRQIEILIRLGYFEEFGSPDILLQMCLEFKSGKNRYNNNLKNETKQKRINALKEMFSNIPPSSNEARETDFQRIKDELQYLSYPVSVYPSLVNSFIVCDIEHFGSAYTTLYNISKGTQGVLRIRKSEYEKSPLKVGDIISIHSWNKKPSYAFINDKPVKVDGKFTLWLESYSIVA